LSMPPTPMSPPLLPLRLNTTVSHAAALAITSAGCLRQRCRRTRSPCQ
jgi:hypothetical protein